MGRFQSCKGVVERALRRAFYDGVLELYEGSLSDRVVCVALEGSLALTINRTETLVIKLNEVAQRADEAVEESQDIHETSSHIFTPKPESNASGASNKPKKRKYDNQSVFPERVVVKREIKQEKVDSDFDITPSSHYDSSLTHQQQPQNERENPEIPAASQVGENHVTHGHIFYHPHTSPESSHESNVRKETDTRKENPEHPDSPPQVANTQTFIEKPEKKRREPAHDTSERHRLHTAAQPPATSAKESTQTAESERESCIRKGPTHTSAIIKQEPETIVIDDEEDEPDSGFSPSSPFTSAQLSSWQHSARQQVEDEGFPMALWTAQRDCPVCGEVFHSRLRLASHFDKHRLTFRLTCQVCRSDTLTLDALHLHMRAVHAPRLLPSSATVTADSLMGQTLLPAHAYRQGSMSAIASLVSIAGCPLATGSPGNTTSAFLANTQLGIAAGGSSRVSQVMEQILTYQSQLARCSLCKLLFASKRDLAAHLSSSHGVQSDDMAAGTSRERKERRGSRDVELSESKTLDPASSMLGQGSFNPWSESKTHGDDDTTQEGEVDLASAAYSCFDCSMGFRSHTAFTEHCILHHDTPSVASQGTCSVCRKSFDTWKSLRSHYYSTHRINSFCDKCKLGFSCHEEMKVHFEVKHGSDPHNMTFVCDICSKGFYSQSQCSAHKRSHVSEKSFACQVCGSAFFKRGDLSKHFRTVHAPNRVFACRFCGKRGTRMDNMRSHVKSHGKHMTRDEILAMIEEVKT